MGEVDSSTLLSVPPGDPSQVSRGGLDAAQGQAGRVGESPLLPLRTWASLSVQGAGPSPAGWASRRAPPPGVASLCPS